MTMQLFELSQGLQHQVENQHPSLAQHVHMWYLKAMCHLWQLMKAYVHVPGLKKFDAIVGNGSTICRYSAGTLS